MELGGIETNPGPSNKETLEWLKMLTAQKYSDSKVEAARLFFGKFNGTSKMFTLWNEKFLAEHKKVRQEAHTRLMKACGGSGKKFDIPPPDFVPHSLTIENKCVKCNDMFENDKSLNRHIKIEHKDDVKKAYSKEAMEMVVRDDKYMDWLNKDTLLNSDKDKITISQLKETTEILAERVNFQSENAYTKVREKNGVTEMQKTVYTTTGDGKVKTSMITQQFIDVTSRKRQSDEQSMNTDPKRSCNAEKAQSKKVQKVVKHLAGENIENQASLVARFLDGQGSKFAKAVSNQSKTLKEQNKFSPEETAALASSTNMPICTMDQLRTAHNNKFGSTPFASRHKVEKAQQNLLAVSRDDWEATEYDLYIHKTGNKVNEKKRTCVFSVKDMKSYIQKNAEAEKNNLSHLKDMEEIQVCYDGDGGGGRFICEFAFINNIDRKIKLHPFLLYKGTDSRENLEVTLGKLTPQFKQLEGKIIMVDGRRLKIHQYALFDLSALNTIMGKQNHSSTFFDAWTDCRLTHIRNHNGDIHTPEVCTDIQFLSLEDFDKFYTHHSVESLASRRTGAHYGSIVANNLLPLRDIYHYIPPVMQTGLQILCLLESSFLEKYEAEGKKASFEVRQHN